jgi:predicted Zn-dependent protease with MMP-like domain
MRDRVHNRVEQARKQRFERIVARALDGLPPEVVAMLDNVQVIVEDEPTDEQLALGEGYPAHPGRARDGETPPSSGGGLGGEQGPPSGGDSSPQRGEAREGVGLGGDRESLFGLYEGVPLTRRGGDYHLVPPDRITIFRRPLERACASPQAIAREVRVTVMHELGHHLGLEEERLADLGLG